MRSIVAALLPLTLAACSSTYHPEYHPVSISEVSENLSYPVTIRNAGLPVERAPILVVPPPPMLASPPPPPAQAPPLPPAEWFRGY